MEQFRKLRDALVRRKPNRMLNATCLPLGDLICSRAQALAPDDAMKIVFRKRHARSGVKR
jgi:hypothetical protein